MTWECKKDCDECCGLIPLPSRIVFDNAHLMQGVVTKRTVIPHDFAGHEEQIFFVTQDFKCVFLDREKHRCLIYNDRPKVCRDYGRIKDLLCCHIDMAGRARTPAEVVRVNHHNEKVASERLAKAKREYDLGSE